MTPAFEVKWCWWIERWGKYCRGAQKYLLKHVPDSKWLSLHQCVKAAEHGVAACFQLSLSSGKSYRKRHVAENWSICMKNWKWTERITQGCKMWEIFLCISKVQNVSKVLWVIKTYQYSTCDIHMAMSLSSNAIISNSLKGTAIKLRANPQSHGIQEIWSF